MDAVMRDDLHMVAGRSAASGAGRGRRTYSRKPSASGHPGQRLALVCRVFIDPMPSQVE
jgi:hypothetical protein